MCGRLNQTGEISWREYHSSIVLGAPRYNVAPTEDVALFHDDQVELARWWLTPSWSDGPSQKYAMFNARCESLAKSPAFRGPFKSQRGVVPMSSFLEWQKVGTRKQPWSITSTAGILYAAALWDLWTGGETHLLSCTIVTTAAAEAFRPWHSRMPVLLADDEIERWLDNTQPLPANDPLFRPALKFPWLLAPLGTAVGNSRNKAPELMKSIGETLELEPG